MKRLLVLATLIVGGIHLFAQSPNTEYVPIDLKWSNQGINDIKPSKPLQVAPYVPSKSGLTFNYNKVTYFIKEDNSVTTLQKDCVLTIKDNVVYLFFGEEYLENRIVSRYLTDDYVTVLKTLDADNTVITYRVGNAGVYSEIDIPGYTIRLEK